MTFKSKYNNKFIHFKKIDKIFRVRDTLSRYKKIRLDKNERLTDFESYFINKIKKKINSNYLNTYPEVEPLYEIFSKKFNLNKEMFVLTAGSDMAIRNCFELLVRSGDKIITIFPTYAMVDVYAKLFEANQVKIHFNKKLELDISKLIKAINYKTRLIIIANPNSPTGTIIENRQIVNILKKAKKFNCYVLIDEAYYDFYNITVMPYLKKFQNLIISRTFSKAYGLAGCRVGLIIANKTIAKRLYKFRPMYEINSISVLIVKEIMKNKSVLKKYIQETIEGKKYLIKNLDKLGFPYYNSYTNFLLVDFRTKNFKNKVWNYFKNKNILITGEPNIPGCKNFLRFTLGPIKYMKLITNALGKFN
jgi:histidinol-phosphate aminotransferase